MTLMDQIRKTIEQRAQYARTRDALRHLPLETQIDLDLNARDTDAIAHRAVYGH